MHEVGNAAKSSFGAVILAAGSSSRMGAPKLLLPWDGTSILGHLVTQWSRLGVTQLSVVLAERSDAIQTELRRINFPPENEIINADPTRGMFSSIQCAAQWHGWRSDLSHWAILLGDQPHIRDSTLLALMDFARKNPSAICQPSRNGRPRHPVVLPAAEFVALTESTSESLSQHLSHPNRERKLLEVDDPGLDFDIDYPADYERAKALGFGLTH